jgi:RNA polymerase sigma factor for flagellar operon FliA
MKNVADLWGRFSQQNDRKAREQLILHYTQLVKFVVGRLALYLPPSIQEEDLIGYGILGLIEAVDRFDPTRGIKFETFAVSRIRGHILDSLRHLDLLSRLARRQVRELEEAIALLSQSLGRLPNDTEIAGHLGLTLDQYHERVIQANSIVVSLDKPFAFGSEELYTLSDTVEDTRRPTPAEELDGQELKRELVAAIQALPERERIMISLYYHDGLTMKEIAQTMGVSESRVSQMHARVMLTLRSLIKDQAEPNPVNFSRSVLANKLLTLFK